MRHIFLFELKRSVSFLATLDEKNLAQTLLEGYYLMMGSEDSNCVVVALTSVAVTHLFKLKLPTTRDTKYTRHLEVVWHQVTVMQSDPPAKKEDVAPFIDSLFQVLDELV